VLKKFIEKFNPNKTEIVLLTRKVSLSGLKPPEIFNSKLNFSKEVKYLGITLGSYNETLTYKAEQKEHMWLVSNVGRTWGLLSRVVTWIYTAIIRPMLTYGAIA